VLGNSIPVSLFPLFAPADILGSGTVAGSGSGVELPAKNSGRLGLDGESIRKNNVEAPGIEFIGARITVPPLRLAASRPFWPEWISGREFCFPLLGRSGSITRYLIGPPGY
jgi:hypothetical protein